MKFLLLSVFVALFCFNADAGVKVKNHTANQMEEQQYADSDLGPNEEADIATLENDIRILDEEIAKCKKQKKGWVAATVIGGVGVVSTGVAAAVQGVKIKDKKDELSGKQEELKSLKKENQALVAQ